MLNASLSLSHISKDCTGCKRQEGRAELPGDPHELINCPLLVSARSLVIITWLITYTNIGTKAS